MLEWISFSKLLPCLPISKIKRFNFLVDENSFDGKLFVYSSRLSISARQEKKELSSQSYSRFE